MLLNACVCRPHFTLAPLALPCASTHNTITPHRRHLTPPTTFILIHQAESKAVAMCERLLDLPAELLIKIVNSCVEYDL